jgi:hypothetical protein
MRFAVLSMVALVLGIVHPSHGQEPVPAPAASPEPEPAPAAEPAAVPPAPPQAPPPPPLLITPRETDFIPDQPHFGPPIPITPAHRLAMLEANVVMPADDPRVRSAAVLLERLTAGYVEDAPRISELTVRVCRQIQSANHPASPFEMLDSALRSPRAASVRPDAPRQFERFATDYLNQRVKNGRNHGAAISALAAP